MGSYQVGDIAHLSVIDECDDDPWMCSRLLLINADFAFHILHNGKLVAFQMDAQAWRMLHPEPVNG